MICIILWLFKKYDDFYETIQEIFLLNNILELKCYII